MGFWYCPVHGLTGPEACCHEASFATVSGPVAKKTLRQVYAEHNSPHGKDRVSIYDAWHDDALEAVAAYVRVEQQAEIDELKRRVKAKDSKLATLREIINSLDIERSS